AGNSDCGAALARCWRLKNSSSDNVPPASVKARSLLRRVGPSVFPTRTAVSLRIAEMLDADRCCRSVGTSRPVAYHRFARPHFEPHYFLSPRCPCPSSTQPLQCQWAIVPDLSRSIPPFHHLHP